MPSIQGNRRFDWRQEPGGRANKVRFHAIQMVVPRV